MDQLSSGYRVFHGVSHILQEPMLCFTNIGKAGLDPTASATNKRYSAGEDEDQMRLIVVYMRNLMKRVNLNVRRWLL